MRDGPPLRSISAVTALEVMGLMLSSLGGRRTRGGPCAKRSGCAARLHQRRLAHDAHLGDASEEDVGRCEEREVTGSLVYRRCCRVDAAKVPDAKTMVRLGQLLDGDALKLLLERLVIVERDAGLTKGRKMRVDTTVVEAPIHHPTDSGMCEDAVRVLSRAIRRLQATGIDLGFHFRNVHRSGSRRIREIAQGLRRRAERAKRAVKKAHRRLLPITGRLARQAHRAAEAARQQGKRMRNRPRRRVERLVAHIETMLPRVRQLIHQTVSLWRADGWRFVTDGSAASECLHPCQQAPDIDRF